MNGRPILAKQSMVQLSEAPVKGGSTLVPRSRALMAILGGGFLAGFLDGMYAVVSVRAKGVTAESLFQYIASGILGIRAFAGGLASAAVGCACHFLIAVGAAAAYYVCSFRFSVLARRPFVCGPVFGLGVYAFMHYCVLPLSAVPPQPPRSLLTILGLLFSHTMFVGLPIALINSRVARRDFRATQSRPAFVVFFKAIVKGNSAPQAPRGLVNGDK